MRFGVWISYFIENVAIMSNPDAIQKGECVKLATCAFVVQMGNALITWTIGAQFSNDSLDSFQLAYLERTSKLNWVNGQRKSLFLSYAAGIASASVLMRASRTYQVSHFNSAPATSSSVSVGMCTEMDSVTR